MSLNELLNKKFASASEAMYELAKFLEDVDKSWTDQTRKDYLHLRVIGNRIFA